MQKISKTVLLSFLMIILGLSAATNSLNESTETTVLDEISAQQEVILPIASLNEPGHQEGSIFTAVTLYPAHCNRSPAEEEVTPFPNPERPPPVTIMYFI